MVDLIRGKRAVERMARANGFAVDDNIRRADVLLGHGLAPGRGPAGGAGNAAAAALLGRDQGAPDCAAAAAPVSAPAMKWQACRDAPGEARYVVCNADEGEPGTFKDRVLLTAYADMVFEGMTLCGLRGRRASKGLLYLRGEYRYLLEPLEACWRAARSAGLLGADILGSGLRLRHRDPSRRRRLHLRRRVGADRIARGQARHAAHPAALPGHARLPGAARRW